MLGDLTPEEIESMLRSHSIGRIGCCDDGITYVVPVSYAYEANTVICHSRDGMKIGMMRRNPQVCFEIDDIRSYDHWRCVIAWGQYEELTEEKDIEHAKSFFSDQLLYLKTTETARPPHAQQERFHDAKPEYVPTIFYRIRLSKISGRFEKAL